MSKPTWNAVVTRGFSDAGLWYTTWINQRLALPLTYLSWRLGLTPNLVSLLSMLCTVGGLAALVQGRGAPSVPAAWLAYALLSLGYVLDSSDGQLARVANAGTPLGRWLDHFIDGMKIVGVNLALGWVLVRTFSGADGNGLLLAYFAFALNAFTHTVYFLGWNFKILLFGDNMVAGGMPNKRKVSLLKLPLQPTDFGLFLLLVLLVPDMQLFCRAYLAYGVYCAAVALAYFVVSARHMAARAP